jgi:hypothetical protein
MNYHYTMLNSPEEGGYRKKQQRSIDTIHLVQVKNIPSVNELLGWDVVGIGPGR